ncbi:hypothetical protein IGI04_037237 [Brassica rapa subsp. trilocularis]|uniref:Uncharacterized protein n=1 Tax=Brassica rapa subsp. trilocularis TaxID=1813537 RepID=A0ABQ7LHN5_BRACM|nr:hypothetical protein IGI04_037237 [Brassica rapa subsp. trilocularis]
MKIMMIIPAWNIAVSDDDYSRKVPSFSGFLNYMESGSKTSVRNWKVLDHRDSDHVQHSCSGLLMLATVNVHRLTTYVTRCNQNFRLPDSTSLDEMTELPYQVECTPPYQLDQSCRVIKYHFS